MATITKYIKFILPLSLFALILLGCSGAPRRKEGIEELKRLQVATHGLHILVSAGITKQEYSQRLEDALLKAGDLQQSAKETVPKFPKKEQEAASEGFTHVTQSIEAYKDAREYFGDKFTGPGCDEGCSLLAQGDYDTEKTKFPSLPQLERETAYDSLFPGAPPNYHRRDMLQALWKVAGDEDTSAQNLIAKLQQ